MQQRNIDGGNAFDWGRTSADYARYRDIYPQQMYEKILSWNICTEGQRVLDLGTGTGVLPRNLYPYGASFTGVDIAENQIAYAKQLSQMQNMDITYLVSSVEELAFPENSFDAVTAFTCFFYFDHEILMPKLYRMLKPGGHLVIGYMAWLPFEDTIAGESEKLILKYNPEWTGCGETRKCIEPPAPYKDTFTILHQEDFDVRIPFSRESWNGRMKACRGIGASLSEERIQSFSSEHMRMLQNTADAQFEILHHVALTDLKVKKSSKDVK